VHHNTTNIDLKRNSFWKSATYVQDYVLNSFSEGKELQSHEALRTDVEKHKTAHLEMLIIYVKKTQYTLL